MGFLKGSEDTVGAADRALRRGKEVASKNRAELLAATALCDAAIAAGDEPAKIRSLLARKEEATWRCAADVKPLADLEERLRAAKARAGEKANIGAAKVATGDLDRFAEQLAAANAAARQALASLNALAAMPGGAMLVAEMPHLLPYVYDQSALRFGRIPERFDLLDKFRHRLAAVKALIAERESAL